MTLAPFISYTEWEWSPNTLLRVRRYFILNAFPFSSRKHHLTTAKVITAERFSVLGENYESIDAEAQAELLRVIEGEAPRSRNTVRFSDYDLLPADIEDNR